MTKEEGIKAKEVIDRMFSKMIVEELKCQIKAYEDTGTVYQGASYLIHRLGGITQQWDDMNKAWDEVIDNED